MDWNSNDVDAGQNLWANIHGVGNPPDVIVVAPRNDTDDEDI